MPLDIKDDVTAALVARLAKRRGATKHLAVRDAVQAELDRNEAAIPIRERLESFWRAHPLPPRTGAAADEAFFDELSGDA